MKRTLCSLISVLTIVVMSSFAIAGNVSIPGTWMVTKDGKPNSTMKLIFDSKGKFRFAGANYSSGGVYKVSGKQIQLMWTTIDGQAVKSGSVKKTLTVGEDNTFIIDRFTYAKYK